MSDTHDRMGDADVERDRSAVTAEVGSEGGSPGDLELIVDSAPGTGSEAGETWRPAAPHRETIVRDESGRGRGGP